METFGEEHALVNNELDLLKHSKNVFFVLLGCSFSDGIAGLKEVVGVYMSFDEFGRDLGEHASAGELSERHDVK
jgi:hypothetical protein